MKAQILCLVLSVGIALGATPTTAPEPDSDPNLEKIEVIKSAAQARGHLTKEEVTELTDIVIRSDSDFLARLLATELLAEQGNDDTAKASLDSVRALVAQLREGTFDKPMARTETGAVVRSFFESDAALLAARMKDPSPVFDFAVELLPERAASESWRDAEKFIAGAPVPIAMRQKYMLKATVALPSGSAAPYVFHALVTPEVLPKLREIAFGLGGDRRLHRPAVDLLVEYGDAGAVEPLREAAEARGKTAQYTQPCSGGIWRIEAQQKPEMLTDFLRSNLSVDFGCSSRWVLDKAVERGVPKETIRSALLARAAQVGENKWLKVEMIYLKMWAIELNVMRPDDLPDVLIPTTQPGGSKDSF
jgi:hypothetical protein